MLKNQVRKRRADIRIILVVLIGGFTLGLLIFAVTPSVRRNYLDITRLRADEFAEIIENIPDKVLSSHDKHEVHHMGEDVEAERLKEQVKVLCWIMTRPETHDKKAKHVKATWGRRCNKLIFMSSANDTELGAIDLQIGDGRQLLWGKTRAAFKYVYQHYADQYHWFFKADDDTYAIMENMRYMLSAYDPTYPIYFGSRFRKFSKQGYMSGGGGYVLSRGALKQFVEVAMPNDTVCRSHPGGAEDAEFGKCLNNIGTMAGDSRDSLGRGRFFPFDAATHLMGGVPAWYYDYVYYKPDTGINCCSDTPVTFHYVSTAKMYELEYLLYHARPYGIIHKDPFPAPLPPDLNSIPKDILDKNGLKAKEKTIIPKQHEDQKAQAEAQAEVHDEVNDEKKDKAQA